MYATKCDPRRYHLGCVQKGQSQARQKHGAGNQLRVANNTSVPVNRKNFLRIDSNKEGLFRLLADAIQEFHPPQGKKVISTHGQNAVSSPISDLSDLYFIYEEADTRPCFMLPTHSIMVSQRL